MSAGYVQVCRLVQAALADAPVYAGVSVTRNRVVPVPANANVALVVRHIDSQREQRQLARNVTDWTTRITVEHYVRSRAGDLPADEIAEPLVQATSAVVLGNGPLGEAVIDGRLMTVGTEPDEQDAALLCVTAVFTFRHRTSGDTLN